MSSGFQSDFQMCGCVCTWTICLTRRKFYCSLECKTFGTQSHMSNWPRYSWWDKAGHLLESEEGRSAKGNNNSCKANILEGVPQPFGGLCCVNKPVHFLMLVLVLPVKHTFNKIEQEAYNFMERNWIYLVCVLVCNVNLCPNCINE